MIVPVTKDEKAQQLVPSAWRSVISEIVDFIKDGNDVGLNSVDRLKPVSDRLWETIKSNVEDYGCTLVSLPNDDWESSACMWMIEYWDASIYLHTLEEGESDLTLSLRIYEKDNGFEFEILSLHVG